jgi:hypothetical protein
LAGRREIGGKEYKGEKGIKPLQGFIDGMVDEAESELKRLKAILG